MDVEKIVSGGQTGVDRAALDVALEVHLPCGGWCPAGRRACDGRIPDRYPLIETKARKYSVRTGWNVRDSDASLIINSGALEDGTELTAKMAALQHKPCLIVQVEDQDAVDSIKQWLSKIQPRVLNVAGPREQKRPGIYDQAVQMLHSIQVTMLGG